MAIMFDRILMMEAGEYTGRSAELLDGAKSSVIGKFLINFKSS